MRKLFFWFFALVLFSPQVFAYTGITAIGDSLFDGGNEDTAVVSYYKLFGAGLTDAPYSITVLPTAQRRLSIWPPG